MSSPFAAPHFRRTRFSHLALCVAVALLSCAAAGADAPLTLAEAQRLAALRSRQLVSLDFASAAAREQAQAAAQLPDPVLKMGIDNLPLSGADRFSVNGDFMTMRRVGLMQEWTGADKRRWRAEALSLGADKSQLAKADTQAALERDTAVAWLDRYFAERMAALVAEQAAQARLELVAAEGGYRGGRVSQADVFAARGAVAGADDRISEFAQRVRAATTRLARWVGDAAQGPLADAPSTDALPFDGAAADAQVAHHPQIAVMARQEQIAQAEANLARANQRADWSVEVAYQQRGPAFANMLSVGVSLPLQWDRAHRQDRELSAKLAQLEQAKAEREEAQREHGFEIRAQFDEWDSLRQRQQRYMRDLLPLAHERSDALLGAYRGGKATLADLLAARRGEIDVKLQALQLQADGARLWAQLTFVVPQLRPSTNPSSAPNGETK